VFIAALSLVALAGNISAQDAPADSLISASEETAAEEINLSRVAGQVLAIPTDLATRFPKAYGGIRAIDNSNLVVSVVEPDSHEGEELRKYVESLVEYSNAEVGRSINITFEPSSVNFERLMSVHHDLGNQIHSGGEFRDLGLTGVGLDGRGITALTQLANNEALGKALQNAYPNIAFTVRTLTTSEAAASRFADTAPWNGGDVLAFNFFGSARIQCTSGPGAHNASGARYLLTAGHCGNLFYYNTNFGNPQLNNPVGPTAAYIFSNWYPDAAIVAANSSFYFWEGPGSGTRRTTLAAVDPVVGYNVCGQGATSAAFGLSNCGTISMVNLDTDVTDGYTIVHVGGLFLWDGSAALGGDSGGYISLSTVYGYGAVGTITSSNPNGSPPYSTGTPVAYHRFIWGLTLNTPSTP